VSGTIRSLRLIGLLSVVAALPCLAGSLAETGADVATAGVVVSNPSLLPPPGNSLGWVDHPCSKEVSYYADWTNGGQEWKGTFALAKQVVLSNIGAPQMHDDGNDVVTTFSATLHVGAVEILLGTPVSPPRPMDLPGSMTARLKGKAGKTTGTFLMTVEAMTFTLVVGDVSATIRQDPAKPASGWISIQDLGSGNYRVDSGLDVFSQIGYDGNWASDVNAPTHYELGSATCPAASLPVADFTVGTASPAAGQAVAFTDVSTGSPASWAWDFGDGGTSTSRNPGHAFAAAGTYVVRLAVTSAAGSDAVGRLVAVGAGSGPTYSSVVWVPAASHAPGKNNSQWRTDLGLLNVGSTAANFQLKMLTGGSIATSTSYVPAGAQSILVDVVAQLGASGSGALEVLSDQPLMVTSRTYNQAAAGTFGQDYAVATSDKGLASGQAGWIPHLVENAAYRSNIGLTNTGASPAAVTVDLYSGAGAKVGSYPVSLNPGEFKQETQPFRNKAGQTAMDRGYAKVTVTAGAGVIATASLIDNATNDPTTIAMCR